MYKQIKFKKYILAFDTFPKTAKTISTERISKLYVSGIRNWIADDSFNYSIVIHLFRIIFSINRDIGCCPS